MCGRRASHAGSTEPFLGVLRFYSGQEPPWNLEVAPDHEGQDVLESLMWFFHVLCYLLNSTHIHCAAALPMTVVPRLRFSRGWTKSSRPRGFPAMAQAPAANAGEHEAITQSMVEITRIVCHYSHIYRTNVILIILISCSILKIRKLIDVFNCIQLYSPWINLFQPVETIGEAGSMSTLSSPLQMSGI